MKQVVSIISFVSIVFLFWTCCNTPHSVSSSSSSSLNNSEASTSTSVSRSGSESRLKVVGLSLAFAIGFALSFALLLALGISLLIEAAMMAELQNDVDLLEQLFNNQQQQLQQMQQQLQKLLKQKSDKYEDNYKLYLTNNGGYGIVHEGSSGKEGNNFFELEDHVPRTPINSLTISIEGLNVTGSFDGCGDSSIRMTEDGKCHPLLRQGPCSNPRFWLTIDPISLKGQCTPRLCGRNRVFVGRDGLCHDASDPAGECGGRGRRLFYTAYGDPICDCPLGQFPFPGPYDPCYKLFTRGPCLPGHVLLLNYETGALECSLPWPGSCSNHKQAEEQQQFPIVTLDDGSCHIFSPSLQLTTSGPCGAKERRLPLKSTKRRQFNENLIASSPSTTNRTNVFLLGYDVFKQKFDCYNVKKLLSTRQADADLDAIFDPLSLSAYWQYSTEAINDYLPDQLLNPCRPGSRSGINFKCANPILPSSSSPSNARNHPNNNGNTKIPYRPAWTCPNFHVLQANGQCISSAAVSKGRRRTITN